jgi:hypothetical protein
MQAEKKTPKQDARLQKHLVQLFVWLSDSMLLLCCVGEAVIADSESVTAPTGLDTIVWLLF